MGRIARTKSGLYRGGGSTSIAYDYQNEKLTINSYEAEQVRKIFKWYLDGMSPGTVGKLGQKKNMVSGTE